MRTIVKKTAAKKKQPSPAAKTTGTAIELPEGTWAQIARKAYELWEQRGRQEGNELRDWLDAEEIVMEAIHEARE